ncbi:MAG: thiamine phosphate synthase [Tannerella sp.]|jgi:thiamine-phosphate pyrophosphorylase|nr:thiamine phosphate synthase [Tannerella sp.]
MRGLLFITHGAGRYDHLQSVEIALKGGCRQIQLRMKDATERELEDAALRAKALCREYRADLYIDDNVGVCKRIEAAGVHLGKSDMPPSEARKILGDGFTVGGTANTFDDVCRLCRQGVDYIGLGPFRFTATKANLSPFLGLEGYGNIVAQCRRRGISLPIVAIGGITAGDIPEIMRTGVSGIALSSTILNADDPVGETRNILKIINQNRI